VTIILFDEKDDDDDDDDDSLWPFFRGRITTNLLVTMSNHGDNATYSSDRTFYVLVCRNSLSLVLHTTTKNLYCITQLHNIT